MATPTIATNSTAPSTPVSAKPPSWVFSFGTATSTRTLPARTPVYRGEASHAVIHASCDPDYTGDCLVSAPVNVFEPFQLLRVHKARLGNLPLMQAKGEDGATEELEYISGLPVYNVDEHRPVWQALLGTLYPGTGSADLMVLDFATLTAVWEAACKYGIDGVMYFAEACIRNKVYLGKVTHAEALHVYVLASCTGREDLTHEAFGAANGGRYEDLDPADLHKLSSADHIRLTRKYFYCLYGHDNEMSAAIEEIGIAAPGPQ